MMMQCRINDQTYLVKILYCQYLLQVMVCAWVKERSLKEIRMNSNVTIAMAYSNVSCVVQPSLNGWVVASIKVIQEDPCKFFHNRITSNRCNNLQERLANGVNCQWDEGPSNISYFSPSRTCCQNAIVCKVIST